MDVIDTTSLFVVPLEMRICSHPLCNEMARHTVVCVATSSSSDTAQVVSLHACDTHVESAETALRTAQQRFMSLDRYARSRTKLASMLPDPTRGEGW